MRVPPVQESLYVRFLEAWRERALVLKAISFGLVGLINLVVDFGVFSLTFFVLGLPIIVANVIAWIVAVSNSYVLNSLTTFTHESGRQLRVRDYLTFCLSQTGGLVTNTATLLIGSYFVPVLAAKVLAIGVAFLVNFSLSHLIVFRRREDTRH